MNNNGEHLLNELGATLQAEADVKIDEVIKLYEECTEDLKKFICRMLNVTYGDMEELRDTLDTIELMDNLDMVKDNIKSNLELEKE